MATDPQVPAVVPAFLRDASTAQNTGLWWERYGYDLIDDRNKSRKPDKSVWIRGLSDQQRNAGSNSTALKAYANRLKAIAESTTPKGVAFELELSSRLAIGMGISSLVENSLLIAT